MRHEITLLAIAIALVFAACSDNTSGRDSLGPTADTVEDTGPVDSSSDVETDTSDAVDVATDAEDSTDSDTSDGGLTPVFRTLS